MDSRLTSDLGPFAPAYPLWTAHLDYSLGPLDLDHLGSTDSDYSP
jgi:hypothetical protein